MSSQATVEIESETTPTGCPYHGTQRKTAHVAREDFRPISQDAEGVWNVRSYDGARAVLRSSTVKQAGFQAETMSEAMQMMRHPMLYLEGAEHINLRKQTARFFTPKAVRAYDSMITAFVDDMLAELRAKKQVDLSELSMKLAVRVAAQVVGLTNSNIDGMAKRIEVFFEMEPMESGFDWSVTSVKRMASAQFYTGRFFLRDVMPAIRARRKQPQEDLISHLIDQEYTNAEILTECITFAAAGMVTTREFISAAAWHLLQNRALRSDYLAADTAERHEILHEILRLEPVVANIFRRTTGPVEVMDAGETVTIPAGELVNVDIYAANDDASVMGTPTDSVCPHREVPRGVQSYGMSFGDGAHRCPGAYIAIEESDLFLKRFLALDSLRLEQAPSLSFNEVVKGYELRDFIVTVE